jgi:transposase, IS5 family
LEKQMLRGSRAWAWCAPAQGETTIRKFRHLLEEHDLGRAMPGAVNRNLQSRGLRIATGTVVDATIIHALSSTKNAKGDRAPEMHRTRNAHAARSWETCTSPLNCGP